MPTQTLEKSLEAERKEINSEELAKKGYENDLKRYQENPAKPSKKVDPDGILDYDRD